MRTLAFSINNVQISLTPDITEIVETLGHERCAELALARHRGEPRAALRTPSWLLCGSGFRRFILSASRTLSPESIQTKVTLLENPEGRLQRMVVIIDY